MAEGNVHNQRHGTGKSYILGNQNLAISALTDLNKKKDLEAKAAAAAAAKKRVASDDPEYYYRYHKDVQGQYDEMSKMYQDLSTAGVKDPYAGTDPVSQQFQQKAKKMQKMAAASMQLKDDYNKTRGQINKNGENHYTQDSILELDRFMNRPLDDIMNSGENFPRLIERNPFANSMKHWQSLFKGKKGQKFEDQEIRDLVNLSLTEPELELDNTYKSKLLYMSPEERLKLKELADENGVSMIGQMAYEDALKFAPKAKPFDRDKVITGMIGNIQKSLDTASSVKSDGTKWSGTVRKNIPSKISGRVRQTLISEPRLMKADLAAGLYEEGPTDKETMDNAVSYYKNEVPGMLKTQSDVNKTVRKGGYGIPKEEFDASANEWLAHLKSGDEDYAYEAGRYLVGYKYPNQLVVEEVNFDEASNSLKLKLTGQAKEAKVKRPKVDPDTGELELDFLGQPVMEETFETRSPEEEVTINLNDGHDRELLMGMYDSSFFGYHKKTPYKFTKFYDPTEDLPDKESSAAPADEVKYYD